MTRLWRIGVVAMLLVAFTPSLQATASAPPTTPPIGPSATNDLLPERENATDCIGTVERAGCGSKARADGHTYLVFLALTAGLAFIGWRIARGVRARDRAHDPVR